MPAKLMIFAYFVLMLMCFIANASMLICQNKMVNIVNIIFAKEHVMSTLSL